MDVVDVLCWQIRPWAWTNVSSFEQKDAQAFFYSVQSTAWIWCFFKKTNHLFLPLEAKKVARFEPLPDIPSGLRSTNKLGQMLLNFRESVCSTWSGLRKLKCSLTWPSFSFQLLASYKEWGQPLDEAKQVVIIYLSSANPVWESKVFLEWSN